MQTLTPPFISQKLWIKFRVIMSYVRYTPLRVFMLFLSLFFTVKGQDLELKYYKHSSLDKEVSPNKARYLKRVFKNADGSITQELKNITLNKLISSECYRGSEPYGVWYYAAEPQPLTIDYNFNITYEEQSCLNTMEALPIKDYFKNQDSIGYEAPKIATGESNIIQYLIRNLNYPPFAKEAGLSGKVYVVFTINNKGLTEGFYVKKGTHPLLDKEAVRTLMQLKFLNPPKINGQAQSVCILIPISFKLL